MIDIDKNTGVVLLHESCVKKIDQRTDINEITKALPSWERSDRKDGSCYLEIEMQNRQKYETLHLLLYFVNSRISSFDMYFSGDHLGDGLTRWSKARERRRKKYHESLFSSVIGKHQWGSVKSVLNQENGHSYIRVNYFDPGT
jgi:hypothetical protein